MLQMHCSLLVYCAILVLFYCFRRSHFRHQSVSSSVQPKRPLVGEGGTTCASDITGSFCLKCRLPRYIFRDLLHAANLRHGTDGEGRRAEDFVALKNPTASAGFEPANLGTKCQHATSRPPKPLLPLLVIC